MSRAPLGGSGRRQIEERLAELVDDIFDPNHYGHLAPGHNTPADFAQARAEGRVVVGLCGFARVPLPPEEITGGCPICAAVRTEQTRLRDVWGWGA